MKRLFLSLLVPLVLSAASDVPERVRPLLEQAQAQGDAFVSVSAASYAPVIAPESIATAYGANLAPRTESAPTHPYPTTLGGIGLQVVDSLGVSRVAPLLYVSPNQINYIVPAGTAPGPATMNIVNGTGVVPHGSAAIQAVAPALFTANGDGKGVLAATAYRTFIPSTLASPVPVFQCGATVGSCVSVPINLGVDTPTYVTLYATGLRGRSSDNSVAVTIGGQTVPVRAVSSFSPNDPMYGIDEVTVGLILSLRGAGEVNVTLSVDGQTSNAGTINIM